MNKLRSFSVSLDILTTQKCIKFYECSWAVIQEVCNYLNLGSFSLYVFITQCCTHTQLSGVTERRPFCDKRVAACFTHFSDEIINNLKSRKHTRMRSTCHMVNDTKNTGVIKWRKAISARRHNPRALSALTFLNSPNCAIVQISSRGFLPLVFVYVC